MSTTRELTACLECGGERRDSWGEPYGSRIRNEGICFTCVFWTEYVETKDDPTHVRVDGTHYVIGDELGSSYGMRGFGGRRFEIQFHDGRPTVVSTNLWYQGQIPDHFKARLPDNAAFVRGTA